MEAVLSKAKYFPFVIGVFKVVKVRASKIATIVSSPLADANYREGKEKSKGFKSTTIKDRFDLLIQNGVKMLVGKRYFIIAKVRTDTTVTYAYTNNSLITLDSLYCKKVGVEKEAKYLSAIPTDGIRLIRAIEQIKEDNKNRKQLIRDREKFLSRMSVLSEELGEQLETVLHEYSKKRKLPYGIRIISTQEKKNVVIENNLTSPIPLNSDVCSTSDRKYIKYNTPYLYRNEVLEGKYVKVYEIGLWIKEEEELVEIRRNNILIPISIDMVNSRDNKVVSQMINADYEYLEQLLFETTKVKELVKQ